jgi:SWI/SNF-related matrix-associated actin-dependent regulator 1 of chromatin subfamily A
MGRDRQEGARMSGIGSRLLDAVKTPLRRYQRNGVRFLHDRGGCGLIGDPMGLGKTIQVLGWLCTADDPFPAVIVCPANGKFIWQDQIEEHLKNPLDVFVASGRKPETWTSDILIINYDIVQYWSDAILKRKPKTLIMDEVHKTKTRSIARTKTCVALSRVTRNVIGMSGTPIINRPVEFFPVLNMVAKKEFPSFWNFAMRYCDPKPGWMGRGWDFTGASNLDELRERLDGIMIRREKPKDLPPKNRIPIHAELNNRKEYDKACNDFLTWYETKKGADAAEKAKKAQTLVKLGALKRLVAKEKLKQVFEWVEEYLEQESKLVVFCHHKEIMAELKKKYPRAAFGGGKDRGEAVHRFQEDPKCKLFIGSILADGTGITLTASKTVLFVELGWTPGEHEQAEDRIHRIGQKAENVFIYYLLCKNTIEDYVWALIQNKWKVVQQVLDGKKPEKDDDQIGAVIKKMKDAMKGNSDGKK